MNNHVETLLAESEKKTAIQNEIISNQKLQISHLTEANQLLKKENQELKQMYKDLSMDYNEVVSMCREQQAVLNRFLDPSSK